MYIIVSLCNTVYLHRLFLRQCELIEHSKMRGDVDNDDNDISNYDYNIHNDSMEFCPNVVVSGSAVSLVHSNLNNVSCIVDYGLISGIIYIS